MELKEFLTYLVAMLKDEVIANIETEENTVKITFTNGTVRTLTAS